MTAAPGSGRRGLPPVGVVTPVYNGERYLGECIESVLAQTYPNWTYTIVDNSSTDATPEIAKRFAALDPRIRYARHDEFVDVVASYNRAVSSTSAESVYCKIVGADDTLGPECLEQMVALAEANPSVGIVSAYRLKGARIDLNDLPSSKSVIPGREVVRESLLGQVSVLGSSTSVLFRHDVIQRWRPFYDPSLRHADTDAAYRVLMGSDFGMIHQVLTYTRISESGETGLSDRLNSFQTERILRLERYGPELLSPTEYRRQLRRELKVYLRWHLKQRLRPSRLHDGVYHTYHKAAMELMKAEGGRDPDVRRTVRVLRTLGV